MVAKEIMAKEKQATIVINGINNQRQYNKISIAYIMGEIMKESIK